MAKPNYFSTKVTPAKVASALGKLGKVLEEDMAEVEKELCEYGAEKALKKLTQETASQNGITIKPRRINGGFYSPSVGNYQLEAKGPMAERKARAIKYEYAGKKHTIHTKGYRYPLVKMLEYGTGVDGVSENGYVANMSGRNYGDTWPVLIPGVGWREIDGRSPIHFMRHGGQMMRLYLPSCAKKVFNANKLKRETGL